VSWRAAPWSRRRRHDADGDVGITTSIATITRRSYAATLRGLSGAPPHLRAELVRSPYALRYAYVKIGRRSAGSGSRRAHKAKPEETVSLEPPRSFFVIAALSSSPTDIYNLLRPLLKQTVSTATSAVRHGLKWHRLGRTDRR